MATQQVSGLTSVPEYRWLCSEGVVDLLSMMSPPVPGVMNGSGPPAHGLRTLEPTVGREPSDTATLTGSARCWSGMGPAIRR